jgi:quercetin dioxygenase-like cupin family protein
MAHEVIKPSFTRTDARGAFIEVLNEGQWEALLTGTMNPGAVLGNHYHKQTTIFFFLIRGGVHIKTIEVETKARDAFDLHSGEGVLLHPEESHAIHFNEPSEFIILKSKRYDPADPDTFEYIVN